MPLGVAGWAAVATVGAAVYSSDQARSNTNTAIDAQQAIADQQAQLGQDQLAFAKTQYDDAKTRQAKFDPLYEQIINQSIADAKTNSDRSAQQWKQYTDYFMPAEQKLSQAALNFDTPGRRDEAGAAARAAVEVQGAQARADQIRGLNRAGVSLSSGRALALDNASRLAQTKISTGADLTARDNVEKTGLSLLDRVTSTGRGLTSTSLAAGGLSQQNNNSAAGGLSTQQQTYNSSLAPAINLMSSGYGSLAGAGSLYANIGSLRQGQANADAAGLGSLASLGIRAYSAYNQQPGGWDSGGAPGADTSPSFNTTNLTNPVPATGP